MIEVANPPSPARESPPSPRREKPEAYRVPVAEILEILEVRQRVSQLSVAEYHQLGQFNQDGRRTELIRGIVLEKVSKSPLHRSVAARLFKIIGPLVPAGLSAWKEDPLTFLDSEPEPDVSVVVGDDRAFARVHPRTAELVIEVAVPSVALDRALASLYAEAGIQEYWIVLAGQQAVEVYRHPEGDRYHEQRTYARGEILTCERIPAITFAVDGIFD